MNGWRQSSAQKLAYIARAEAKTRTQKKYKNTSMLPLLWKRLMGGKKEAAPHRIVQGWVSRNGYGS